MFNINQYNFIKYNLEYENGNRQKFNTAFNQGYFRNIKINVIKEM